MGHKRKKVKDIRGQITNSVPYIEVFRHMQRLRKQPKGRSILGVTLRLGSSPRTRLSRREQAKERGEGRNF